MEKKFGCTAFTAFILLLCMIPSLGMLLPKEETEAGGNQVIAATPSLRNQEGTLNKAYLSQLLDYVEDHHFLHQKMITAWSALNVKTLHTSITKDVILGKNNWLYYGETLSDYTGAGRMSNWEIYAAARNLALVAEYCEQAGMQFLFTIAPNKNSLYPENMPEFTIHSGPSNAEALGAALETEGVPYLNLFEVFRSQDETLYFTQDSHWNSKGAALAADAVNAALNRESSYFDGPFVPAEDHRSDLYDMLCPAGPDLETDLKYGGTLDFTYDMPIRSAENLTIMTTGTGSGSLYMFRDSFGNPLYPYLADSYEHTLFSRSVEFDIERAVMQEADTVVIELVERNLDYLLQNLPVIPAPKRELNVTDAKVLDGIPFQYSPGENQGPSPVISGTLPAPPDTGFPVYLYAGDSQDAYEVFLLENNRFALYGPSDRSGELSLIYTSGGQTVQVPLLPPSGPILTESH
ncbi:MAG: hypothetical protein HFF85_10850 [Oscillibacter sp.]|nr:hypothetical protein [Oscillibacter sp.]